MRPNAMHAGVYRYAICAVPRAMFVLCARTVQQKSVVHVSLQIQLSSPRMVSEAGPGGIHEGETRMSTLRAVLARDGRAGERRVGSASG